MPRYLLIKKSPLGTQAEFVAMGHPLLEPVVDTILARYAQSAMDGATFIDPEGKKDGVIWFAEAEIKDGRDKVAGKKLFAVYQNSGGGNQKTGISDEIKIPHPHHQPSSLSFINPAILWDLKLSIFWKGSAGRRA